MATKKDAKPKAPKPASKTARKSARAASKPVNAIKLLKDDHYDQHNFASYLAQTLRAGDEFRAVSDCVTSPTYVPDLVRTMLDLVVDDGTGIGIWSAMARPPRHNSQSILPMR